MIAPQQVILRLVIATVLGSIVGLERERLDRAAGLRTHALVGLGAALFMLVSAFGFTDIMHAPQVSLDPSRVAAQVVSGIGFLGAGTIILRREIVRGLTTAASVWAVAAVGLAVGGGLYLAAASATLLALTILVVFKPVETRWFARRRSRGLSLTAERHATPLIAVEAAVEAAGLHLEALLIQPAHEPDVDRIEITFQPAPRERVRALMESLRRIDGVQGIYLGGARSDESTPP
jgi:putative Mg2+ transporter-C (MgtC) family protein